MNQIITRKFIAIIILTIITAPVVGYYFASHQSSQENAAVFRGLASTPSDIKLQKMITRYSVAHNLNSNGLKIISKQISDGGWELVEVTINTNGSIVTRYVLISLFSAKQGPVILLGPGEQFVRQNISSGLGVPYSIIDTIMSHAGDGSVYGE